MFVEDLDNYCKGKDLKHGVNIELGYWQIYTIPLLSSYNKLKIIKVYNIFGGFEMKVVYASRQGHVEGMINKLGLTEAVKIENGSEVVEGDYVLFTYTDGAGVIPGIVEKFLENNTGVKAVVGSGNRARHEATFNFAADKIAEKYGASIIAKVDDGGTDEELEDIKKALEAY